MIVGRVDGMNNGKVYGWAFNSESPAEHVEIRVSRGAAVIASGRADRFRKDLPEAGIGDGDHAFEIATPDMTSFRGLMVVARSAGAGEAPLPIATNDDRRMDDLFQIFSRRYDDVLVAFKAEIDEFRKDGRPGTPRVELPPGLVGRIARLEKRLDEFEVFAIRLDEIAKTLQEQLDRPRSRGLFSFLLPKSK